MDKRHRKHMEKWQEIEMDDALVDRMRSIVPWVARHTFHWSTDEATLDDAIQAACILLCDYAHKHHMQPADMHKNLLFKAAWYAVSNTIRVVRGSASKNRPAEPLLDIADHMDAGNLTFDDGGLEDRDMAKFLRGHLQSAVDKRLINKYSVWVFDSVCSDAAERFEARRYEKVPDRAQYFSNILNDDVRPFLQAAYTSQVTRKGE